MKSLLHIGFTFRGPPKVKELEPVFDKALAWVRYAPNCWLVQTTATPERWLGRLKLYLGPKDLVCIVELTPNTFNGILPQWIWDWIEEHQPKPRSR